MRDFTKRTFDLAIAVVGLIALAPLLAALAVAIKGASPGPIFFRQRRVGRGGGPFLIFHIEAAARQARRRPRVCAASEPPGRPVDPCPHGARHLAPEGGAERTGSGDGGSTVTRDLTTGSATRAATRRRPLVRWFPTQSQ